MRANSLIWAFAVVLFFAIARGENDAAAQAEKESHEILSGSVVIPAGEFFEINARAKAGAELRWQWRAEGGKAAFDIHTHFGGAAQYLFQKSAPSDSGFLTAKREGGHSYLWRNGGASAITLHYEAAGDFAVISYYPPR